MGFYKNTSTLTLSRIISLFTAFLISVISSRYLGAEGKGIFAIFSIGVFLFYQILSFSIPGSIIYLIQNGRFRIEDVIFTNFFLSVILPFLSIVIFYILKVLQFSNNTFDIIETYKYFWCINVFVFFSYYFHMSIYYVEKKYNYLLLLENIPGAALVLLSIIFGHLIGVDAKIFIMLNCFAFLPSLIHLFFHNVFFLKKKSNYKFSFRYIKELIRYGGKMTVGNILFFFILRLNFIDLLKYHSLTEVGFYSISFLAVAKVANLLQPLQIILFTETSGSLKKKNLQADTMRIIRVLLLLLVPVAILLFFSASFFIPIIFGKNFTPSIHPFQIHLFSLIFLNLWVTLWAALSARGKAGLACLVQMILLGINYFSNRKLIPLYGTQGAAWSANITHASGFIIFFVIYYLDKLTLLKNNK